MFGNLKSKIEGADLRKYASPQVLSSLTGSRQRSNQHSPGSQTPSLSRHSRAPSDASLTGATTSPSVLYSTLQEHEEASSSRTKNGAVTSEQEIEKLKNTLESQQDAALQRFNAKEQEWKGVFEEDQKKISKLEEEIQNSKLRERELQSKLSAIENEKKLRDGTLLEKDAKLKDLEEKLINLHEDYDNFEGLSMQEVSKIKHLLQKTTLELETSKKENEEKSSKILALEKRLSDNEVIENRIKSLGEEKMDLETKIAGLTHKMEASSKRHLSVSEQYEEEINNLKERIAMLEQRNSNESLEESQKSQAFAKERESYEHKLEEKRQELSSIKTSWSQHISALESQIQNLNTKIAEDQVDFKACEEEQEVLKRKVDELTKELEDQRKVHEKESDSLRADVKCLQEDLESSKWQLETETNKKSQEIKDLRRKMHMQDINCNDLTKDIQSKMEEIDSLKSETERLTTQLATVEKELSSAKTEISSLEDSNNSLQENLNRERTTIDEIEEELKSVKEKHNTASLEKSKLSSNLDKYLEEVKQYETLTKSLEQEKQDLTDQIKALETSLEDYKSQNSELKDYVQTLETDFESKIEDSDLVKSLRTKLKVCEDEISEKKQMYKVQAQRIEDMKKTMKRDFGICYDALEATQENAGNQLSPRITPDNSKISPKAYLSSSYKTRGVGNSVADLCNGSIEADPVNLEYLKHVVLKFITSREYEAVQLTRAVATLLNMNEEEENLLRETLQWKMSWFGSRPNIGKGQMAKAIPPTQ